MRARAAAILLVWGLSATGLSAQVCRLSVAGLNRERRVVGPVSAECPNPLHSSPFGNWGATSNFGEKRNGRQFEGWCREQRVCDNAGSCWTACRDGWLEWNSCTTHSLYAPPNCWLYNAAECTEQVSTSGVNVLGTQFVDLAVSCPRDTDGDGVADAGGCRDLRYYSHGVNFMSLYELDPGGRDELIQTLYFPETPVLLDCGVLECPAAGSLWVGPVAWDPPAPRRVFAEMAAVVNYGIFMDTAGACRGPVAALASLSAASYRPVLAPGSLASSFGNGLAPTFASASSLPLPFELAGLAASVTDVAGRRHRAPLIYASPSQVNWLVPEEVHPGPAVVSVSSGGRVLAAGAVEIERLAPALFTANADGAGAPAAIIVRLNARGEQSVAVAYRCRDGVGTCEPAPLEAPRSDEQVILLLFGTGIRGRRDLADVRVVIGGVAAEVHYAGAQPQYPGLDQVNVRLPGGLVGRGPLELVLSVEGVPANPVRLQLR